VKFRVRIYKIVNDEVKELRKQRDIDKFISKLLSNEDVTNYLVEVRIESEK